MKKLIQNPNLQQDLAEALHQTVKENYLIDKVNEERGELVENILSVDVGGEMRDVGLAP